MDSHSNRFPQEPTGSNPATHPPATPSPANQASPTQTPPSDIPPSQEVMTLHQGDCITLNSDENVYQVIGVDDRHNRCWVRRWPLARHGSPVFEISLQQVASSSHPHPPRKPAGV